eukprot:Gb_36375 [translate_table: standard]
MLCLHGLVTFIEQHHSAFYLLYKLRAQALASLHSGLQKNQGIPVAQVVKWLAMEREDMEALLKYHGFFLKQYEEVYMVKEGPFLNKENDLLAKRSQLVYNKRSAKVIDDVISSGEVPIIENTWHTVKAIDGAIDRFVDRTQGANVLNVGAILPSEEMPDYEEEQPLTNYEVKDWQMQELFVSNQDEEMPSVKEVYEEPIPIATPTFGIQLATPITKEENHVMSGTISQQEQQPRSKRKNDFSTECGGQYKRRITQVEDNLMVEKNLRQPSYCHGNNLPAIQEGANECIVVEAKCREEEARLAMYKEEVWIMKLKLLLRRWKRQATKKIKERHMRQVNSRKAFISLSVGPPVRPKKSLYPELTSSTPRWPISVKELNLEQLWRERQNKLERMWMRLDVPDLIAPVLSEKNPQAKCLCWKLILCSRTRDKDGYSARRRTHATNCIGRWLLAKVMGNDKTNNNWSLAPDSGMAILKKQVDIPSEHNGARHLCCLCILKDASFNLERVEREDLGLGASGILFLLLEDIQWDLERARLESLVSTLPQCSKLPLLIVSSINFEDREPKHLQAFESVHASIESQLGLHLLDRNKISNWSIHFITDHENNYTKGGFLSDDCLRNGLLWLAHQAPMQPVVYPSDARDLVREYFEPYLDIFLNMKPSEVMPEYCIHVFNEALNRAAVDIASAARNSHPGWPPPEIELLDGGGQPGLSNLPKSGWNTATNIETILYVLQFCKLPQFPPFDFNYTSSPEIEEQKFYLQKILYEYLTQVNLMRKDDIMALKEFDLMLQTGTVLEHNGLRYCIIPKWATIFQRIYRRRLMLLVSEPPFIAYVSRPRILPSAVNEVKHLLSSARQVFHGSMYARQVPLLDEMVQVSTGGISRHPKCSLNVRNEEDQIMNDSWHQNPVGENRNRHADPATVHSSPMIDLVQEDIVRTDDFRTADLELLPLPLGFPPTEGELQLGKVATEFCEKVDEQIKWTQLEAQRANSLMNSSSALVNATRSHVRENEFSLEIGDRSHRKNEMAHTKGSSDGLESWSECPTTISGPTWATNDGMEMFNWLMEQCENVQRTIDNKLNICFSDKNKDSDQNQL